MRRRNSISALIDHEITINNIDNLDTSIQYDVEREQDMAHAEHHILSPYKVTKMSKYSVKLTYRVTRNGSTLREYINEQAKHIKPTKQHDQTRFDKLGEVIRTTFMGRPLHALKPNEMILIIIDAYIYMMKNNFLISQNTINPDSIWVDRDADGKMCVYVIDMLDPLFSTLHSGNQNYWSPEMLGRYNYVMYYQEQPLKPYNLTNIRTLNRKETRCSTLGLVYSLGLILYLIVAKHELFTEDEPRFSIYEMVGITNITDPKYKIIISLAIEPELTKRPRLEDWRDLVIQILNPYSISNNKAKIFCC
jgi:hypothetical protein